jgi:outer membrane lipoprotein LolB
MCVSVSSLNRPDRGAFLPLAALLLLAGCAAPKSALLPNINAWDTRTTVLAGLEAWEFSGRIAVRTGNDGFNGKLRYSQDEKGFKATVRGPLGIGTVRLEGDDRNVVLTDKDGIRTELQDAELELRYRYGWTIPVASLRFWALGIPDPAEPADTELNENGQLESLRQQDWSVSISRYRDGGGQLMPSHLTAENSDTRVRLVIDHWIFHPQEGL